MRRMIAMPRSCAVAAVFCLGSFLAAVSANALDVGVARCDITPDVMGHKVPLAGYGARKGQPSTGVHDPLHAKVLFFRDGKTSMAVVTCDLRSVTPQLKQQTLQKATDLGLPWTPFSCAPPILMTAPPSSPRNSGSYSLASATQPSLTP